MVSDTILASWLDKILKLNEGYSMHSIGKKTILMNGATQVKHTYVILWFEISE